MLGGAASCGPSRSLEEYRAYTSLRVVLSWLIAAAVASVAGIAVIDAVRGGDERTAVTDVPAESSASEPEAPRQLGTEADVNALRSGSATGELLVTDRLCRSRRLLLPELELHEDGTASDCARDTPTGWTSVSPSSDLVPPSCLLDAAPAPQGCALAAVPLEQLEDSLVAIGQLAVEETAWLSGWRLAVIVRDLSRELDMLAIIEHGRLASHPTLVSPDLVGLSVGPRRQHVAVRTSAGGVFVIDDAGRLTLPGRFRFSLLDVRGIAWSPDEAWTAIATRERVYVVATDPATTEVIDVPLSAALLEWR